RTGDQGMRLRLQGCFDGAIRAYLDGVGLLLHSRTLINAKVEARKTYRHADYASRDAHVTFGFVGNHVTGRDQIEIFGIAEPEIELRKLHSGVRIPAPASAYEVNL